MMALSWGSMCLSTPAAMCAMVMSAAWRTFQCSLSLKALSSSGEITCRNSLPPRAVLKRAMHSHPKR